MTDNESCCPNRFATVESSTGTMHTKSNIHVVSSGRCRTDLALDRPVAQPVQYPFQRLGGWPSAQPGQ